MRHPLLAALLLLTSACTTAPPAAPGADVGGREAGRCDLDPACIDADTIVPTWFGSTPNFWSIPDQNGDGETDLFQPNVHAYVGSPFPSDLKLPEEATGIVLGEHVGIYGFADYTDDGVLDLLSNAGLVEGPLVWPIDLAKASGVDPAHDHEDLGEWVQEVRELTGDLRLDLVLHFDNEARVWADGPASWGKGEPTFTLLHSTCVRTGTAAREDYEFRFVNAIPDIDNDGSPETCFYSAVCGAPILLPGDVTGTIDVDLDPRARRVYGCPFLAGDQTGDGVTDVMVGGAAGWEVHQAPVQWAEDGGATDDTLLFTLEMPEPFGTGQPPGPIGTDLDGDGLGEFVQVLDPTPDNFEDNIYSEYTVYTGGVDGGVVSGKAAFRVLADSPLSDRVLRCPDGGDCWLYSVTNSLSVALVPLAGIW